MRTSVFELPFGLKIGEEIHKECEVSVMTGVDEEEISDKKIARNGALVITKLLANKVIRIGTIENPTEEHIRAMFTGDRDMALVEIRKISLGNVIEMVTDCRNPNCSDKINVNFDLQNVTVRRWDPENNPNHKGEFGYLDFELIDGVENPVNKSISKKGRLYLPTGYVEERITPLMGTNPGKGNTALLTACIKELEGFKMVNAKVVRDMTRRDREYLTKLIKDNQPGPQLYTNVLCDSCIKEFKMFVELPYFFTNAKPE